MELFLGCIGFDISLASGKPLTSEDAQIVQNALTSANLPFKAVTVNSNVDAFISFLNSNDVSTPQNLCDFIVIYTF